MSDPMMVLGLDLSIAATGVCDVGGGTATWKLPASGGDGRLCTLIGRIFDGISEDGFNPDLVAIEGPVTRSQAATVIGMVHGAVRVALIDAGIPYVVIPPASLKKYATGKGNADKTAMAMAGYKRAGLEFADDNQCDAWWLRAMTLDAYGEPVVEMPAAHREALVKVQWPTLKGYDLAVAA